MANTFYMGYGLVLPEVLELDAIDNLWAVHSNKRVLTSYTGSLIRIRRSSDSTEQDIGYGSDNWVDSAAISAFIGGGSGFVTTVYDQTGNTRNAIQATAGSQPILHMALSHPCWEFTTGQWFSQVDKSFSNARSAISLIAVRKYDATAGAESMMAAQTNAAPNTREALVIESGPIDCARGRRLDAESGVNASLTVNTSWVVAIGRFDHATAKMYYRRDSESVTTDPFATAGSTSATNSANLVIGQSGIGTNFFTGKMTMAVWVRDLLTDPEVDTLIAEPRSAKALG